MDIVNWAPRDCSRQMTDRMYFTMAGMYNQATQSRRSDPDFFTSIGLDLDKTPDVLRFERLFYLGFQFNFEVTVWRGSGKTG
ncbi:hypothetical protein [Allocoleopsis franciscana]|uniref:Uncharacterized protein n=1 Tax=Allocoleopsis franciscana PCC 7113 TaxID=1173027 RepID=K9WAV9_9CYAN|nr:hypothetical protein [Allocoleopsis franciscana]AFZ16627.1 hypothetical protein Mic7113_0715 [Allocoleopsis franciscana PCC 7113]